MKHPNPKLKTLLDSLYKERNKEFEINEQKPDPLGVARDFIEHKICDEIMLFCALLSYGNAKQIVKTLRQIDFEILVKNDAKNIIKNAAKNLPLYRFQTAQDLAIFMAILKNATESGGVKNIFLEGYNSAKNELPKVVNGINFVVNFFENCMENLGVKKTAGLNFLIGKKAQKLSAPPFKRWNMFLRWMVRSDNLDLGLWKEVKTSDLILPLDTHTFKLCQRLGLTKRKNYDLKCAIESTQTLALYDYDDPVKYDFALYRIGQENLAQSIFLDTNLSHNFMA